MPVYNNEDYLKEAIESIQNQTISDVELICVDDGSTDNSLEILNNLSSEYGFIKVFSQENAGSGSARNKGLDNATGQFVAFLDSDDLFIEKDALEVMYDTAISNNSDMVSANLVNITPNRKITNSNSNCNSKYKCFEEYAEISPDEYGIPWSFYKNLFKRDIIEENNIRFPDLRRGQDPVFLADFLSKIKKIHCVPKVLYGYMVNSPGVNNLNNSIKKLHYLIHYEKTFELLDAAGLMNTSKKYKLESIKRLQNSLENGDLEYFKLFLEVFKDTSYYENYPDDMDKLYINYLFSNILIEDSEEYFQFVKSELTKFNLWKNNKIQKGILRKFILISSHEHYNEFKIEYLQLEYLLNSITRRQLKKENNKLTKIYNKNKDLNDMLINSNSLKLVNKFKK